MLIVVVWGVVALNNQHGRHTQYGEHKATYEAYAREHERVTLCKAITGLSTPACVTQPPKPDEETHRAYQDLRAQEEMADWALLMFFATLAGVIITIAGLIYIVRAYLLNAEATEHASVAANAATQQAALARRAIPQPFLQLKPGAFVLAGAKRSKILEAARAILGDNDSANYTLFNHGQAIAVLTDLQARLVLVTPSDPFPGLLVPSDGAWPNAMLSGSVVEAKEHSETHQAHRNRCEGETDEHMGDLLNEWYLQGFATYSDGLDRRYVLGFCYAFWGFGWARSAPTGINESDANYHREITQQPNEKP